MQQSVTYSAGREGCKIPDEPVLSDVVLQRVTGSVTESRMPTPCDAALRYQEPHWSFCFAATLAWIEFCVFVCAGSRSCQRHNKVCSEHYQYRNKQRHWQPRILFAAKSKSLSHFITSIIFELCKLFIFPWLISKMVFAERGETISGGNFHGEYPAKVRLGSWLCFACLLYFLLGFLRHTFFSGRLWTFYLLRSMSWPLSARGGLKGCATRLWASCLPSWSMRVDSIQASWLHTARLLHWVRAPRTFTEFKENVLIQVFMALFDFSFREQGLVSSLLCGLSVHQCCHRGPCVHGRLGCQEGSEGCGACWARWCVFLTWFQWSAE